MKGHDSVIGSNSNLNGTVMPQIGLAWVFTQPTFGQDIARPIGQIIVCVNRLYYDCIFSLQMQRCMFQGPRTGIFNHSGATRGTSGVPCRWNPIAKSGTVLTVFKVNGYHCMCDILQIIKHAWSMHKVVNYVSDPHRRASCFWFKCIFLVEILYKSIQIHIPCNIFLLHRTIAFIFQMRDHFSAYCHQKHGLINLDWNISNSFIRTSYK